MSQHEPHFATTQWTLVWQAAGDDAETARPALTELIRRYWFPLYGYARRRGMTREDAEDATQEFLGRLVQGEIIGSADPTKGKFRTFLLVAWKRFLTDVYRRENTLRRGGDVQHLSLDFEVGEQRWLELNSREPDADRAFLQNWADSLLEEARDRLKSNYAQQDRLQVFEALMPRLTQQLDRAAYEQLGHQLGMSPSSVKVAIHRLRQRFGQTLRDTVLETLDDSAEIDREITDLLEVLGRRS